MSQPGRVKVILRDGIELKLACGHKMLWTRKNIPKTVRCRVCGQAWIQQQGSKVNCLKFSEDNNHVD